MKLRYYMRGLGIGIIVTALVMGIATRDRAPLTDAEIKAAAYELGMVDSSSLKLSDIQPPSESEESKETPNQENTEEHEESRNEGELAGAEESRSEGESADSPEDEAPASASVSESEEASSEEPEQAFPEEPEETVTITIKSGSGSRTVCNQLKEAGLIEDAGAFDQYLMDNGYSRRICVGTYEIELGADWERIAKIVTRTK